MPKVAVMAGTPIDTRMGADLLNEISCELLEVPISGNPAQQTYFQTLPVFEKMHQIEVKIKDLQSKKIDLLLVYCNSLSASIDFDFLAKKYSMKIITPFQVYADLAQKHERIGVLTANGQGAAGIESVLVQHHSTIRVYNVTNLDWVHAVEAKIHPSIIVEQFGLTDSMSFFMKNQVEAILIGCTHFPYFLTEYQSRTRIPCINPDDALIEKVKPIL
ncbi:aspartate/glutamate racemase family protein [Enterococcus faecium]|uniref:aspartate/glutamate racemase family protein n=1 Tax=Enterococcus faecium TaxID=1352 RepID=UPI0018A9EA64|nr:aspartate/glutamate racemase family protein [Enterococcus faecium]MDB7359611.1 aspartate/glutamate racemase family protein [Enterococcus faecium]MDB7377740.1 aspartate/glutamate racemase family protein [Enterococcus faecium]MDB7380340.1 aspartate/glutamate racemase family protein [Enterococcus faecium]MDB7385473.1 aspartate/glutamate racemase family protein [Enterococcus faecium]MDB7542400.1 aspartate/glutamate racemase family protein [Enterococcus faecium]